MVSSFKVIMNTAYGKFINAKSLILAATDFFSFYFKATLSPTAIPQAS